jgi:ABC-type bacteriocin/lantibiotic exporter with double-glycine peptidase domain
LPNRLFAGGASSWKRLFVLFLIISSLLSCAETLFLKESKPLRLIENVPFYPQEAFQCGPASLAGVLNFWGIHVTPEEVATEIFSPSAGGTLNLDMMLYPEKKGLKAIYYKGSMDDIKNKIDSGYPMIVLVNLGLLVYQQNHFMVVVGYDENGIIAHSGRDRLKPIRLKNFIKTWEKTNFWTLWIKPQQ